MYVNLIHRPGNQAQRPMFELQQKYAHDLKLKTTVFLQYDNLFEEELLEQVLKDQKTYGDEIGIWFANLSATSFVKKLNKKETFLWLFTEEEKRVIIEEHIRKFESVFGYRPISVGCYHMDSTSLRLLHEISPETKISVGGCFEEGVKVFHGCNHSWYLFNEGMPFFPWYPAKHNSLVPARSREEWDGIVLVPHLMRDMALSYEGRNDFFASHPANIQRAMANEGAICPYTLNLLDMCRFQERFNEGFSYSNTFVGPNWLSGSINVQDSDEETQQIYKEYLEYLAQLSQENQIQVVYMREFADAFTGEVEIGAAQQYFAKEILYGSYKHYFWYCSPAWRLLLDMEQGGSIGDLRPYIGRTPRCSGADTEFLAMASNPYLIQSQYRSGNAHHSADGARTTLLIAYEGEEKDLCDYPTRIESAHTTPEKTKLVLQEQRIAFECGLSVTLQTSIEIYRCGKIIFHRALTDCSQENAVFCVTEYVKAGYGVTEYPENLKDVVLYAEGADEISEKFGYTGRTYETAAGKSCSAVIPKLNVRLSLENADDRACSAYVKDGYLFSPYYTLGISCDLQVGKETATCLNVKKEKTC